MLLPCNNLLSPLGRTRRAAAPAGVESEWCVSFDGVNDGVSFAPINVGTTHTVCAWVYVPVFNANKNVILGGNGETFVFWRSGVGDVYYYADNNGCYVPMPSWSAGQWVHLTAVRVGTMVTFYLNGVSQGSSTMGLTDLVLRYVGYYQLGYYTNGRIDDVRIYSRAISSTEVAAIYNNISPPIDVTARLPLETDTGTTTPVLDSTGATIATATLVGGATWHPQTPPKLVSGRETSVRSLVFDKTADTRVDCGASSTFSPLSSMTVAFWIKKGVTPTAYDGVMGRTSTGSWYDGWGFYWQTDSQLRFWINAWNSPTVYCYITDSHWHHVVGEWDGAYIRIYLDGLPIHEVAFAGPQTGLSTTLYLGRLAIALYDFSGLLDDVRIYSSITTAQIRSLARGQSVAGAVAHWKGDETSGTLVADYGSGGNNGTCVGGVGRSTDVSPWLAP